MRIPYQDVQIFGVIEACLKWRTVWVLGICRRRTYVKSHVSSPASSESLQRPGPVLESILIMASHFGLNAATVHLHNGSIDITSCLELNQEGHPWRYEPPRLIFAGCGTKLTSWFAYVCYLASTSSMLVDCCYTAWFTSSTARYI